MALHQNAPGASEQLYRKKEKEWNIRVSVTGSVLIPLSNLGCDQSFIHNEYKFNDDTSVYSLNWQFKESFAKFVEKCRDENNGSYLNYYQDEIMYVDHKDIVLLNIPPLEIYRTKYIAADIAKDCWFYAHGARRLSALLAFSVDVRSFRVLVICQFMNPDRDRFCVANHYKPTDNGKTISLHPRPRYLLNKPFEATHLGRPLFEPQQDGEIMLQLHQQLYAIDNKLQHIEQDKEVENQRLLSENEKLQEQLKSLQEENEKLREQARHSSQASPPDALGIKDQNEFPSLEAALRTQQRRGQ